jgi:catechol 2,3-dioxygenase-like lactoylglutathione lyase family enzyme
MERMLVVALLAVALCASAEESAAKRPRITGIDHVCFFITAPDTTVALYSGVLGLAAADPIEPEQVKRYMVGKQWVGYKPANVPQKTDRLDHMAFTTDDVAALQHYLASKGVSVPNSIRTAPDGSRSFAVKDPEGYTIEFVERAKAAGKPKPQADGVSRRLIHAGFVVHSREAQDRFYREILGFHPYWHGGMEPGRTDWVALQVPDGADWLEYMLNQPTELDLRLSGVMNHISLGVLDMGQAEAKLVAHGWKPHGGEHSQMGLDGKRQLNVFDADLSRVELMEFRPSQKPCCSDFQGPHPSEDD